MGKIRMRSIFTTTAILNSYPLTKLQHHILLPHHILLRNNFGRYFVTTTSHIMFCNQKIWHVFWHQIRYIRPLSTTQHSTPHSVTKSSYACFPIKASCFTFLHFSIFYHQITPHHFLSICSSYRILLLKIPVLLFITTIPSLTFLDPVT